MYLENKTPLTTPQQLMSQQLMSLRQRAQNANLREKIIDMMLDIASYDVDAAERYLVFNIEHRYNEPKAA
ncbi:hypothetical protein [Brasilonema sp. UFV-L1]|uniref:hypothetical protein n=1 Tax=Brasilonema sp. UFV-L1 TaxID=2234130 RepID=UPI00145EC0F2|nr:hypothetical protein [Brasilonema sp. UFV-L1]NMG11370.1 hypothetical protein [Brasilonema sp. UFV-L1]